MYVTQKNKVSTFTQNNEIFIYIKKQREKQREVICQSNNNKLLIVSFPTLAKVVFIFSSHSSIDADGSQ